MTFQEMARIHFACFAQQRPWSASEIAEMAQNPRNFVLNRERGFLIGQAVVDEAEVLTLAVDPCARRQGIARALVAEFIAVAGQKGANHAFLEVEAQNVAALSLYQSFGFAKTGLRRDYYQRPDGSRSDALILSCPLSPKSPAI